MRELENTVNQIVLLGEKSFMAPGRPGAASGARRGTGARSSEAGPLKEGTDAVSRQYERRVIAECLKRNGGNKSKTARELRITRKTLAQKIARYGLSG